MQSIIGCTLQRSWTHNQFQDDYESWQLELNALWKIRNEDLMKYLGQNK